MNARMANFIGIHMLNDLVDTNATNQLLGNDFDAFNPNGPNGDNF